jgi:hypothetical protein
MPDAELDQEEEVGMIYQSCASTHLYNPDTDDALYKRPPACPTINNADFEYIKRMRMQCMKAAQDSEAVVSHAGGFIRDGATQMVKEDLKKSKYTF